MRALVLHWTGFSIKPGAIFFHDLLLCLIIIFVEMFFSTNGIQTQINLMNVPIESGPQTARLISHPLVADVIQI